jgi:MFS family permease
MIASLQLLRRNPAYARLWGAQAVSLIGDWFNTIVLSALVSAYTGGSGLAISLLLLARFLPPLIVSPLAGVLLDRYDRRLLLIVSDVVRIFVVLGFLFVTGPERVWLIYALTIVQFSFSALFEPGRSALLPAVVQRDDLVAANILGSVTWSVMLAVGGALGGLVSGLLGTAAALIIDAATFAISALLIWSIRLPADVTRPRQPVSGKSSGLHDYLEGLRYARRNRETLLTLLVKAGGNVGNIDALLIVYATVLFVVGADGSGSLGILWSAFGIGAVLGPILVERWNNGTVRAMRRIILAGYVFITVGWFLLAGAPGLLLAAIAIIVKAIGSSLYWTYSSAILQKTVDDAYLGRIFSLDMAGFQLFTVLSIIVTGAALEAFGDENVRAIVVVTGVLSLIPLVLWAAAVRWLEHHRQAVAPPEPATSPVP